MRDATTMVVASRIHKRHSKLQSIKRTVQYCQRTKSTAQYLQFVYVLDSQDNVFAGQKRAR